MLAPRISPFSLSLAAITALGVPAGMWLGANPAHACKCLGEASWTLVRASMEGDGEAGPEEAFWANDALLVEGGELHVGSDDTLQGVPQ